MNGFSRRVLAFLALALATVITGCTTEQPATPGLAFATPQAAVDSVVTALRANDRPQLEKIFGSDSGQLLSSGDDVADARGRETFLTAYDQKHQLKPDQTADAAPAAAPPEAMTLEVGDNQWPLPIPIVKGADGWRFDTAAGLDEMLNRRIGRNELDTIETCRAIADAQREYFALNPTGASPPAYAARLFSTEGRRDGLYWPVAQGEPLSPMGEEVADAIEEGYTRSTTGVPHPYHGYLFHLLKAQGRFAPGGKMSYLTGEQLTKGFAIVAYPADYGNSGLKTFIMNHHGLVFQRDLGDDTTAKAKAMNEFDPGPGWEVVVE